MQHQQVSPAKKVGGAEVGCVQVLEVIEAAAGGVVRGGGSLILREGGFQPQGLAISGK